MQLNTVIFDIDGLIIDSEPLWNEAAAEVFRNYGIELTEDQYRTTTGLRTKEFVQWWLSFYKIDKTAFEQAENSIVEKVLYKIEEKGEILPGVPYIFDFFYNKQFKIGLATSSPPALIELVVEMAGIKDYLLATSSAEDLPLGKPHPQVYLNCAALLNSSPLECICFEDSFNGMIAAKAARMACVVVPHFSERKDKKWGAANLKLPSLKNFGEQYFNELNSYSR